MVKSVTVETGSNETEHVNFNVSTITFDPFLSIRSAIRTAQKFNWKPLEIWIDHRIIDNMETLSMKNSDLIQIFKMNELSIYGVPFVFRNIMSDNPRSIGLLLTEGQYRYYIIDIIATD